MQQALEKTGGNREEASRMLGIGERTLYRVIQDWKLQDKISAAVKQAGGNLAPGGHGTGNEAARSRTQDEKMGHGADA